MPLKRSWTDEQLTVAVVESQSVRGVLIKLKLIPAGGNYQQVNTAIAKLALDTSHFTGQTWNIGQTYHTKTRSTLESLLVIGSTVQSYKL